MGSLSDLYNKSFIIYRNTTTTSTGTDIASATFTGNCLIQPITDQSRLMNANNWGKEYKLWTDNCSVRVGDLVQIDSIKYGVVGIPEHVDLEDNTETHLELRIVKK